MTVIEALVKDGARVKAYDPVAMDNARQLLPSAVEYCEDSYDAIDGADAMIIVTEWNQFRSLDIQRVRASLKKPVIVDLRNLYDPQRMRERGISYISVGRAAEDLP